MHDFPRRRAMLMVIGTSAWLAIFFNEPDAEHCERTLEADPIRLMCTAPGLETAMAMGARLGEARGRARDVLWSTDCSRVEDLQSGMDRAAQSESAA